MTESVDGRTTSILENDIYVTRCSLLWIRTGECCRCGQCCQNMHDLKTDSYVVCRYLSFDKDGLAVCELYGTDKYPYGCEIFPIAPDPQYDKCTYVFTAK